MALVVPDLPLEVIVHILSFLPIADLLQAMLACRAFYHAANITYSRQHHQQLEDCIPDFKHEEEHSVTFSEVQNSLMKDFKYMLGTWRVVSTCYGGLVHVQFDGFKLVGTRYSPPPSPHVTRALRSSKIFTFQVDRHGDLYCVCYRGYDGPHLAKLEKSESDSFDLSCDCPEVHAHKDGTKVEYSIWLCEELGMEKNSRELHIVTPLHLRKFEVLSRQESKLSCERLILPGYKEGVVIQPGLFKGTYGDHGLELVSLTYEDDDTAAVITKITGDPNVPAGKITVKVDLTSALHLTEDEQDIPNVWTPNSTSSRQQPSNSASTAVQPFRLPVGYVERTVGGVPSVCQARYHSQGQIAATGYMNPMFVEGHWVVFDADTFGHVWIFLTSFSLYSRVTESFRDAGT